jgi:hypothetical protein
MMTNEKVKFLMQVQTWGVTIHSRCTALDRIYSLLAKHNRKIVHQLPYHPELKSIELVLSRIGLLRRRYLQIG